ncbi:MAG: cytochrome P450 [Pseudomonadales bacterium]
MASTAASVTSANGLNIKPGRALNLLDPHFTNNKQAYYDWMREHAPVHTGRITVMRMHMLSRYDDCLALTKDPRFGRNRARIVGNGRKPFPLPKSLALLSKSMIIEDDPEHKRLRKLVQPAFTPRNIRGLEEAMVTQTHELLDQVVGARSFDLIKHYALPIPTTMIGQLVGVSAAQMPKFQNCLGVLSEGFSGWGIMRTLVRDMPKVVTFVRELIDDKRANPGEDLLSTLVHTEQDGDRLTEAELVSMVFLLIVAGYETTVHLISNGVLALATHPEQWQRLRENPALLGSAVEEILRFNGPIHGTKMNYAKEDVELRGVLIPKGKIVIPLLSAANHDPDAFPNPEQFDIARTPNRHLGFSQGPHFCLGAFLARLETKVALRTLLERMPNLQLAVAPEALQLQKLPLWHRYQEMPMRGPQSAAKAA